MVGILSDIGNTRKINEDAVGFYENDIYSIYVIADGMGGHNAGEVASALAIETTLEYVKTEFLQNHENTRDVLINAVKLSNDNIYKLAKSNETLTGMGTTLTACLLKNRQITVANVGDSSCYIIKQNEIIKITKDHSLVQQLIDNGTITAEEAVNHPNKNVITRALGTNRFLEVDIFELADEDVSKIILCTDGLTNEVSPSEICDVVMNNSNDVACEKLIQLSKYKGGRDNISVIVVEGECKNDRNFTRK